MIYICHVRLVCSLVFVCTGAAADSLDITSYFYILVCTCRVDTHLLDLLTIHLSHDPHRIRPSTLHPLHPLDPRAERLGPIRAEQVPVSAAARGPPRVELDEAAPHSAQHYRPVHVCQTPALHLRAADWHSALHRARLYSADADDELLAQRPRGLSSTHSGMAGCVVCVFFFVFCLFFF